MLFQKKAKKADQKPAILANATPERWKKFHKLTLADVDETEALVDVSIVTTNGKGEDGNFIENLALEYAKEIILFPFSRGLVKDTSVLDDDDVLESTTFYYGKKMKEGDEVGKPTGDFYISFGKPSGIIITERRSLVKAQTVDADGNPIKK